MMATKTIKETKLDMGNNESVVTGIYQEDTKVFLALTPTNSRRYKTLKGAERWLLGVIGAERFRRLEAPSFS